MLTRRDFLVTATAFGAFSLRAQETHPVPFGPIVRGSHSVPTVLDHLLLGSADLDAGIAFIEEHLGVRAAFGGIHPGRGTQNALLSLGDRRYLEIIAPDPNQQGANIMPMFRADLIAHLNSLPNPRLIGWAAHPGDLNAFATKLRASGIAFQGPTPGSRKRPDGRLLQWKTLNLENDEAGLLPFFIEWAADSPHPSTDAPVGCSLAHFELATPDPESLQTITTLLELDVLIHNVAIHNQKAQLRTSLVGPKGQIGVGS